MCTGPDPAAILSPQCVFPSLMRVRSRLSTICCTRCAAVRLRMEASRWVRPVRLPITFVLPYLGLTFYRF